MKIRVRLFASMAEAAGTREVALHLPPRTTAGEAFASLVRDHAALAAFADRALLAVNAEYADAATVLADGDELALIPPVSGGAICS